MTPPSPDPLLDGYCPVALVMNHALEAGSPDHQSSFDRGVYQMTNERSQTMFDRDPERFVPPFDRQDPVLFERTGELREGQTALFAMSADRAWFFATDANREAFRADPTRYETHINASGR